MIISLQIPSILQSRFIGYLKLKYGNNLLFDYRDELFSHNSSENIKNTKIRKGHYQSLKGTELGFNSNNVIHGFFLPYKYDSLYGDHDVKFITWIDHPLDVLRTLFAQIKFQTNSSPSNPFFIRVIREKWDFSRFAMSNEMQNFITKLLWNFPIEKFDFIGSSYAFSNNLMLFQRKFSLPTDGIILPQNSYYLTTKASCINDPQWLDEFECFHQQDIILYNKSIMIQNEQSRKTMKFQHLT